MGGLMSKRKNTLFFVIISTFVFGLINLSCIEWPWGKFKPNPNLSLFLTSDIDSTFFLESFFLPRFSPEGGKIYFLSVSDNDHYEGFLDEEKGGDLFYINLDSTELTLIRGGNIVRYYTISSDGKKIFLLEDSLVKIINLENMSLDSLPIKVISKGYNAYGGFDISSNGEWLYYQNRNEYRKFNLLTQEDSFLFQYDTRYFEFDLSPDDTLLLIGSGIRNNSNNAYFIIVNLNNFSINEVELPYGYYPATSCFSRFSSNFIIFPKRADLGEKNDFILFNIITGELETLNATITKKNSVLLYPYLSSDERKIIFSASTNRYVLDFEIWILNKITIK
jgi:hypothetical protein